MSIDSIFDRFPFWRHSKALAHEAVDEDVALFAAMTDYELARHWCNFPIPDPNSQEGSTHRLLTCEIAGRFVKKVCEDMKNG